MLPHFVPGPSKSVPACVTASPLLERLRMAARSRGDSQPTAENLVAWARAFILFHNKRHPSQMGLPQVTHFLEHVVKTASEPLPALAQARAALTLLYGGVLGNDLGELPQPRPPRVLDQLRLVLRVRHDARRTEDCYCHWAKRFILYHQKRHPRTMSAAEVEQFLTHLAVDERVSASTQNQALNALLFFYTQARAPVASGGTTFWKGRCNGPWRRRAWPQAWIAPSIATPSGTVSPRIWSRSARISAWCNCSWVTKAWRRQ